MATEREKFVSDFIDLAIRTARETGINADVILGQASLESDWGRSGLAQQSNNIFGVKGPGRTWNTKEDYGRGLVTVKQSFREYPSAGESFRGWGSMMNRLDRYQPVREAISSKAQIKAMARSGYATDSDYENLLSGRVKAVQRTDAFKTGVGGAIDKMVGEPDLPNELDPEAYGAGIEALQGLGPVPEVEPGGYLGPPNLGLQLPDIPGPISGLDFYGPELPAPGPYDFSGLDLSGAPGMADFMPPGLVLPEAEFVPGVSISPEDFAPMFGERGLPGAYEFGDDLDVSGYGPPGMGDLTAGIAPGPTLGWDRSAPVMGSPDNFSGANVGQFLTGNNWAYPGLPAGMERVGPAPSMDARPVDPDRILREAAAFSPPAVDPDRMVREPAGFSQPAAPARDLDQDRGAQGGMVRAPEARTPDWRDPDRFERATPEPRELDRDTLRDAGIAPLGAGTNVAPGELPAAFIPPGGWAAPAFDAIGKQNIEPASFVGPGAPSLMGGAVRGEAGGFTTPQTNFGSFGPGAFGAVPQATVDTTATATPLPALQPGRLALPSPADAPAAPDARERPRDWRDPDRFDRSQPAARIGQTPAVVPMPPSRPGEGFAGGLPPVMPPAAPVADPLAGAPMLADTGPRGFDPSTPIYGGMSTDLFVDAMSNPQFAASAAGQFDTLQGEGSRALPGESSFGGGTPSGGFATAGAGNFGGAPDATNMENAGLQGAAGRDDGAGSDVLEKLFRFWIPEIEIPGNVDRPSRQQVQDFDLGSLGKYEFGHNPNLSFEQNRNYAEQIVGFAPSFPDHPLPSNLQDFVDAYRAEANMPVSEMSGKFAGTERGPTGLSGLLGGLFGGGGFDSLPSGPGPTGLDLGAIGANMAGFGVGISDSLANSISAGLSEGSGGFGGGGFGGAGAAGGNMGDPSGGIGNSESGGSGGFGQGGSNSDDW